MIRFAAVLLTVGVTAAPSFGEPPPDPRPRDEQTLFFRAVLRELGAQPVIDFNELMKAPAKSVLIVLGPTSRLNSLVTGRKLSGFLAAGGSVLIATDQGIASNVSSQIGAVVDGRFVQGSEGDHYRSTYFDCPLIHEYRRPSRRLEAHPIFRDLPHDAIVATNRPSFLSSWLPPNRPLVTMTAPGAWFRDSDQLNFRQVPHLRVLGVVNENDRGGRLLVLADHSIFIDMMVQPDNHNLDFTFGVLRWLTEDGKRTQVLMIDNDAIQTNFNVSLVRPPMPPMPSIQELLPIISQGISDFQREDRINQMIQRSVPQSTMMRGTVLILTLVLLAAGTYCFLHARHRFEHRPKLGSMPAESPESEGDNYAQSSRELAAEVFREFGPSASTSSEMPSLAVRGSRSDRRGWQSQIQKLWSIAHGADGPNSPAGLKRVHADCQAVRAAVQSGVVQFTAKS